MSAEQSTAPEVFLPIPGFPGYDVGTFGTVRSYWIQSGGGRKALGTVPRILKPSRIGKGYLGVVLCRDGKRYCRQVHVLVLLAHVGPCPPGQEACHDPDRNPANCRLDNLRYDTSKNNHADRKRHGRTNPGAKNGNAKLTDAAILDIRAKRGKVRQVDLAKEHHVGQSVIIAIQRREIWTHV